MSSYITHIIPDRPDSCDGLSQYACILADHLSKVSPARFIVLKDRKKISRNLNNKQHHIYECDYNSNKWREILSQSNGNIVLHYSGYGYSEKGVPQWLVRDLENFKRDEKRAKIITVFHELEACTSKLSSALLLAPIQRWLCSRLFAISNSILVTIGENYNKLARRELFKIHKARLIPICSTIGENDNCNNLEQKEPIAIVFGTLGRRLAVYSSDQVKIMHALKKLNIKKIVDIGEADQDIPDYFAALPVEKLGTLTSQEIRQQLSKASLGLIEYPGRLLGKSSIFAAYCAFNVATLLTRENENFDDGLYADKTILTLDSDLDQVAHLSVSERASNWYASHNISQHVAAFKEILQEKEPKKEKHKVALVMSQPTQNEAPQRELAHHEELNFIQIQLSSQIDSHLWKGDEYINKEVFEENKVSSLATVTLPNISPFPSLDRFYGIINSGINRVVRNSDCVVLYGHRYLTFWWAILLCKLYSKPLILTNDAIDIGKSRLKQKIKRAIFPILYRYIATHVLVTSSLSKKYITSFGINPERVTITPYTVDNELILNLVNSSSRSVAREKLGLRQETEVVLFCGKLIDRKNPIELVRSFSKIKNKSSVLLVVGDGPLKQDLISEIKKSGLTERVKLLGLVPYKELPSIYKASDILVHPATDEPFGLIVNEAFLCGTCVITSDKVGSSYDLILQGKSGFCYPSGDEKKLTELLDLVIESSALRQECQQNAKIKIEQWSPRANAEALCQAVSKVVRKEELTKGERKCGF